MTPTFCRVRHDPPNSYGDCLRACIASLLDMDIELVWHFADSGRSFDSTIERLREWLKGNRPGSSFWLTHFPSTTSQQDLQNWIAERNPDVHYLLFSEDHVVIGYNNKVVHNPAWYKTPLVVPSEVWTIGVICDG